MNCWNCGQAGHFAADCTNPATSKTLTLAEQPACYVCGQPGHMAVACDFHPSRLRNIRGDACGDGPCTINCRTGDHHDCAWSWCTCICHRMQQEQMRINAEGVSKVRSVLARRGSV